MTSNIRIGTAGWTIPRACAEEFGGEGSHLERYARSMNAVEINSSFHRPHRRSTYERWAAATPESFRFSVKLPRLLTHDQRLAEPEAGLDRFAAEAGGLGARLGALLVQLPPSLTFQPEIATGFFDALRRRLAAPVACEPRHASWFQPEADAFLRERCVARVAADPARTADAADPGGWGGFAYVRLHGSPRIYYSAYERAFLKQQAERVQTLSQAGPVWCVLDNTAGSAALGDAAMVKRLVESPE